MYITNVFPDNFIEMVRRSNLEPTKKYKYPLTTSHEIGWITTPLVNYLKFYYITTYFKIFVLFIFNCSIRLKY